jgi:hypothetical protein
MKILIKNLIVLAGLLFITVSSVASDNYECLGGVCFDLSYDRIVSVSDFYKAVGWTGEVNQPCADVGFNRNGVVDAIDLVCFDWALGGEFQNYCNFIPALPLVGGSDEVSIGDLNNSPYPPVCLNAGIFVLGKRNSLDAQEKVKDRMYYLSDMGSLAYPIAAIGALSDRCNIRLITDLNTMDIIPVIYQINSRYGIRKSNGTPIVPPGKVSVSNEPRFNRFAWVYVGIHGIGEESHNYPILDAEVYNEEYAYIAPVVVLPMIDENPGIPYTAAAMLHLDPCSEPPYSVIKIYDGPFQNSENQNVLQEIEIDSPGNVFVLSSTETDRTLWKFAPDGSISHLTIDFPSQPTASMCVSKIVPEVYLLFSCANCSMSSIFVYSSENFELLRLIAIDNMQHATALYQGGRDNPLRLWVVGYNFNSLPRNPYNNPTFYEPYIAYANPNDNYVNAYKLESSTNPEFDLALPLSITYGCLIDDSQGGGGGYIPVYYEFINFEDYAIFTQENDVDINEAWVFCQDWLTVKVQ